MPERDELDVALDERRRFAKDYPVTKGLLEVAARMPQLLSPYSFMYGKFCISVTYETFCTPPRWHVTATILEDIGELEFGAPQQAVLATQSWTKEDERDVDKLLRHALAPMDLRQSQVINIHKGQMSWHYILDDDFAPTTQTPDWTESRVIH